MSTPERLRYLLARHVDRNLSSEERTEMMQLILQPENEDAIKEIMERQWAHVNEESGPTDEQVAKLLSQIMHERPVDTPVISLDNDRRFPWRSIAAAIAIVLLSTACLFLIFRPSQPAKKLTDQSQRQRFNNDVLPGGNRAVLTLADGSNIALDSAKNGRLADQDAATIRKVADGQLTYDAVQQESSDIEYNTLTTPKGGQYTLTLPDGSKVWLNSLSSIRFPTGFPGADRKVEITGEAYFEVVKNAQKPFIVNVEGKTDVEVLGTHFNIMAYPDEEAITTTLLEGRIRVNSGDRHITLMPGQQVRRFLSGDLSINMHADTEQAIAWKAGLFHFEDADISTIMRQFARWYNIEVVFQGAIPTRKLTGEAPRSISLNKLLQVMQLTDIHFKLEDNKIIILP